MNKFNLKFLSRNLNVLMEDRNNHLLLKEVLPNRIINRRLKTSLLKSKKVKSNSRVVWSIPLVFMEEMLEKIKVNQKDKAIDSSNSHK